MKKEIFLLAAIITVSYFSKVHSYNETDDNGLSFDVQLSKFLIHNFWYKNGIAALRKPQ